MCTRIEGESTPQGGRLREEEPMAGQAAQGAEPTLDLVLAQVQATKAAAAAQIAALDTKAGLVLGSASFLAAAVAGLQSLIAGKPGLRHTLTVLPIGIVGHQGLA